MPDLLIRHENNPLPGNYSIRLKPSGPSFILVIPSEEGIHLAKLRLRPLLRYRQTVDPGSPLRSARDVDRKVCASAMRFDSSWVPAL